MCAGNSYTNTPYIYMRAVFVLALALAVASATPFTVPPASEWYSVYFVDSSDTFIVKVRGGCECILCLCLWTGVDGFVT